MVLIPRCQRTLAGDLNSGPHNKTKPIALLPVSNAIAGFDQKVSLSQNCICRGIDPMRVEAMVPI